MYKTIKYALRDKNGEWFTTNNADYEFETSKELNGNYLYSKKSAEQEAESYKDLYDLQVVPILLKEIQNKTEWIELREKHGDEKARKIVVDKLRELANTIEADGYPNIYNIEEDGFGPVSSFKVMMSYPWGG